MHTPARASTRMARPAPSSIRRLLPMLALGSVLLAAGGGAGLTAGGGPVQSGRPAPRRAVAHPARHITAPVGQATSLKPDWRGDAANTGQVAATGPATLPAESVADAPGVPGVADGIELSADGSALFTLDSGVVYAYRPDGARKWAFPASGTLGGYGHDLAAGASHPTVGADGADYIGNDNGSLYQLDDATGAGAAIFQAPAGAALQMTPKRGSDGTLYIGDGGGAFYHLAPPALGAGAPATLLYSVTATGAPQPPGSPYTGASRGPFRFYGEAALDGAGDAYVASSDVNPQGTPSQRVGTLYKVGPRGAILWRAGLQGAPVGAVVYAANPVTPTQPLVVVADRFPEVAAFDAATGARVWQLIPPANPAGFDASPALSPDGRTLYAADDAGALAALDVATGGPAAGFGVEGRVALPAGTQSSPVVDAAGTLYLGTNDGALVALAPDGRTLWTLPGGLATGASGSGSAKDMSPAIGADGTLYAGGNGGAVRGFRVGGSLPTATPGPAGAPPTPSATTTAPSTPSAAPSATATSTDLPTPSGPTPTFPPGPPPGTDLFHLNTANAHYLAAANGTTELRLYNAPVGLPDARGWHLRDPGLRPAVPLVASPSPRASVSPASPGAATSPVPLGTSLPLARQRARAGLAVPTLAVPTPGVTDTTVALTDTGLLTVTDPITPAALPFGLHLAPTANSPALASLTNEDGVSLTLALASIGGGAPAAVPGVVGASGDAITYTAPVASAPADLALHPTVSGLDLRLVLHTAAEAGPLTLALAPSAGAYLEAEPGGAVQVTRPFTAYGDDGTAHTILSPEYVVHAPVAHDAADATGDPAASAPVSLTLGATPSGVPALLLTVDSAWLRDARRAYPVTLDLPLATAYSAVHSGLAATVNSCAPTVPDTHGGLTAGRVGGCASHGLLSFNTTPLLADTPIVSATLRLYTPDQTGQTGIHIYPNTPLTATLPVWEPSPYLQPTWASAPAVVTGSVGIDQSASDGRWQSWDVTDLVRGWIRAPRTNGGLTLASDGALVRLASSLRIGRDAPAFAPYLDIIYGPRPSAASPPAPSARRASTSPAILPGGGGSAASIYGVSGDFAGPCGQIECGNKLGVDQTAGLGARYIRVQARLDCSSQLRNGGNPGIAYWNGYGSNSAAPTSPSSVYAVLSNAYYDGLIPIVAFVADDQCASSFRPPVWGKQIVDFLNTMRQYSDRYVPSGRSLFDQLAASQTYFEVFNEINFHSPYGYGLGAGSYRWAYKAIFMTAAGALNKTLGNAPWVALTSGMTLPTANGELPCTDASNPYGYPNLATAAAAIRGAEGAASYNGYPLRISTAHLGVAVHPYGYDTQEYVPGSLIPNYWNNYYGTNYQGTSTYGPNIHYEGNCTDLQAMINTWTAAFPPPMKVVFTEDNYTLRGNDGTCTNSDGCEGTYLVDLVTWLHDHNGYDSPGGPLIVTVFTGVNFGDPNNPPPGGNLGLYKVDPSGGANWYKSVTIQACPNNSAVAGTHAISVDYALLIGQGCY